MVSFQGTFQFFDNTSFESMDSINPSPPLLRNYPSNSIMGYVQQYHPQFAYLIELAKLAWQMADPSFRGTLWLPPENSLSPSLLLSMDINDARRFVKYHLMIGLFPQKVLKTSLCQQLQTSIKGSMITAFWVDDQLYLNQASIRVHQFDILCSNGIIHKVSHPLLPL